jgi:hypothetical protein
MPSIAFCSSHGALAPAIHIIFTFPYRTTLKQSFLSYPAATTFTAMAAPPKYVFWHIARITAIAMQIPALHHAQL